MSWRLNHPSTLVERWFYGGPNALGAFGRYDGTLVNAPTWSTTAPKNSLSAIELDGDDAHVNVGDITQLNAVPAFTLCFWMNQDVLDQIDYIFDKGPPNNIQIFTYDDGRAYFAVAGAARGHFDYSTVVHARNWHHSAMVFDGSQTGDANRLIVYVDGIPITLAFTAAIPATTPDLSGVDATIGETNSSFDGRLWDFRLYNVPLSRDEVNKIIHGPAPVL